MEASNIALGTVIIIFLFFLPGIIFIRFYYTGYFARQFVPRTSSVFSIIPTVVPSFVFQILFYLIVKQFTRHEIDLEILAIPTHPANYKDFIREFTELDSDYIHILTYNFSLWAFAAVSGKLSMLFIRKLRIDRKTRLFRFENHWHYLLRGESLDFPNVSGDNRHICKFQFNYIPPF